MMKNKTDPANNNVPSVWRRIAASLIDYLVILVWMATIGLVGYAFSQLMGGYPDYLGTFGPLGTEAIFFLVLTFPIGIYLYVSESGTRHATIGKLKVGMRVAARDGGPPSKKSILIRTIVKLLPWEMAHGFIWQMQYVFYQSGYEADIPLWILAGLSTAIILAIIYVAMIAVRQDGRAPHDLVAGTRVYLR